MSRDFRFPSHRLQELIKAPKCPASDAEVKWKDRGEKGKELRLALDLVDGPFAGFAVHVTCGDGAEVTSYRAALILEGERVRGVDYSLIERRRFYRDYLVKGWHENVIDPNLPSSNQNRNRHEPLNDFEPSDLESFLREVCRMWHIDLEFGEALL
jgi:hypothetical protein